MRFVILDITRIVAITLLLLSHISGYSGGFLGKCFGIPDFYYVTLGGVSVSIFLVLSGITLTLTYNDKSAGYWAFLKKRLLRIYSMYYICLAFGGLVAVFSVVESGKSYPFSLFPDLLLSLTGFYAFVGRWGGPILNTSWFIGLIVALYFLFPPLFRLIKKSPSHTMFMLILTSTVSRYLIGHYSLLPRQPLDWFPLCRIAEFGFGIFLAVIAKPQVWTGLSFSTSINRTVEYLSNLSFPLFLVHFPLEFLLVNRHYSHPMGIAIFLVASLCVSACILVFDNWLHKRYKKTRGSGVANNQDHKMAAGKRLL
jgi:peptidoglycan/LPS O-acetylase OafA/YrhL